MTKVQDMQSLIYNKKTQPIDWTWVIDDELHCELFGRTKYWVEQF